MNPCAKLVAAAIALCMITGVSSANEAAGPTRAPDLSITGVVNDALNRPLGGVELVLESTNGKIIARSRTDKSGHFAFKDVHPGSYTIVANKGGFRTSVAVAQVRKGGTKPVAIAMESEAALSLKVTAKRLDTARNGLSTEAGSSVFKFSQTAIKQLPQGSNSQMSSVLPQAPGVVQDSFGGLHIRGEHADLQYRINGIELPEGIAAGFSQVFSPRFAENISLLEGALPAQYGYRTAGVVDMQTKSGAALNSGSVEMYGGQRYTLQPSFEMGGNDGPLSYYTTGFYQQTSRGLEPPTPGPSPIHDFAQIGNGFGDLSYVLSPSTRVTLLGGFNLSNYQIPANPDQPPAFKLASLPDDGANFPSADVRETQLEQNYFGVLAFQGLLPAGIDYLVAGFSRYSTLSFHPDQEGDLIFNGVASRVFRSDWANGLQGDFAYHEFKNHTIRAGFYFTGERAEIDNHSLVFPAPLGIPTEQLAFEPSAIVDNHALTQWVYGAYLQDEWRPIRKLTINYGVRFDLYDGLTRSDQFSPRAGAIYQLAENTALHAGYARYFTPPPLEAVSSADINKFKGTTNEPLVFENSTIAPERANYFDAGVTQVLPLGLKVDLDSYYKMSRDLIDEGQFGPTLIFTPFNYEKGRQYGVEFSASWNYRALTTYANFAYSVAQGIHIVSDQFLFAPDELAYISGHYVFLDHDQTFTESAGIAYDWRGFLFTLNNIYGSGLRDGFANTGNLPFYIQFDAAVVKSMTLPSIGKVEGRVAVVNLGDWIYQIRNGSGIGVFASQYGPRRSFYGGLRWYIPFFNGNGAIL